ncbi:hypothetical protein ACFX2B_002653 [Malus domestica]
MNAFRVARSVDVELRKLHPVPRFLYREREMTRFTLTGIKGTKMRMDETTRVPSKHCSTDLIVEVSRHFEVQKERPHDAQSATLRYFGRRGAIERSFTFCRIIVFPQETKQLQNSPESGHRKNQSGDWLRKKTHVGTRRSVPPTTREGDTYLEDERIQGRHGGYDPSTYHYCHILNPGDDFVELAAIKPKCPGSGSTCGADLTTKGASSAWSWKDSEKDCSPDTPRPVEEYFPWWLLGMRTFHDSVELPLLAQVPRGLSCDGVVDHSSWEGSGVWLWDKYHARVLGK